MEGLQQLYAVSFAGFQALELGAKLVQEQRADDLEDVLFSGVVRARLPAFLLVHDRLKQRTEDRRRNPRPVELSGIQQALAHFGIEGRGADRGREQPAVHIGKPRQVFVQGGLTLIFGGIENVEKLRQQGADVRPILFGAVLKEI
nr:hypothetical protein [Paracoccus sp. (in: a-proteobacteria)]